MILYVNVFPSRVSPNDWYFYKNIGKHKGGEERLLFWL